MRNKAVDPSIATERARGHLDIAEASLKAAIEVLAKANQPELLAEVEGLRERLKACRGAARVRLAETAKSGAEPSSVPVNHEAVARLKPKLLVMDAAIDGMSDDEWGEWINSLEFDEFLEFLRHSEDKSSLQKIMSEARAEETGRQASTPPTSEPTSSQHL